MTQEGVPYAYIEIFSSLTVVKLSCWLSLYLNIICVSESEILFQTSADCQVLSYKLFSLSFNQAMCINSDQK